MQTLAVMDFLMDQQQQADQVEHHRIPLLGVIQQQQLVLQDCQQEAIQ